ncbi:MAG: hypothetical protein ABI652_07100 [Acidobacteriota bacterium]
MKGMKGLLNELVAREFRVALSRTAQPAWFRVVKWVVIVAAVTYFWRARDFWWWLAGLFAGAIALHLVWRAKTQVWTRPWGGWNDIEAARGRHHDAEHPPASGAS